VLAVAPAICRSTAVYVGCRRSTADPSGRHRFSAGRRPSPAVAAGQWRRPAEPASHPQVDGNVPIGQGVATNVTGTSNTTVRKGVPKTDCQSRPLNVWKRHFDNWQMCGNFAVITGKLSAIISNDNVLKTTDICETLLIGASIRTSKFTGNLPVNLPVTVTNFHYR
jgi:hypothetical protein